MNPEQKLSQLEQEVKCLTKAIFNQSIASLTQNMIIQFLCKQQGLTTEQSNKLYDRIFSKFNNTTLESIETLMPEVSAFLDGSSLESVKRSLYSDKEFLGDL